MNPAFYVGQQVGTNFANARKESKDVNNLDRILSEAMQSNDPNVLHNNIGQILRSVSPERQPQAIKYLENRLQSLSQQEQRRALEQEGVNPNLPPKLQQSQYENLQSQKAASSIINPKNVGDIQQSQQDQGFEFNKLSDEQLVQLRGVKGFSNQADSELKRRQEDRKIIQKQNSDVFKSDLARADKVKANAEVIAQTVPKKQTALSLMKDAVASKNLGYFSPDNLAELTGIEGFRSPEGAVFKTAGKEYFLGNISRAGARPNQWIEQQIADMMAKIGRSPEANFSVLRALENELDLDKKTVELTNEISDRLRSQGDLSEGKLGTTLNKELSQYAEKKQDVLFNDLRAIKSIAEKKPPKFKKVVKGTKVSEYVAQSLLMQFNNDPKKAEEEARKLGYEL